MTWKKMWILLILTILLVLTILTKTAKADTSFNPPDQKLAVNSTAPFSGVLINESRYRELTIDYRLAEDLKAHMDNYVNPLPPPLIKGTETKAFVIGGVFGAIATIIAVIVLH
jgi:hypothetical protein